MKRFLLALPLCALPFACTTTMGAARSETATQVNADRSLAHASNGEVINGPSLINERVLGQYDVAGNIHVDATTPPRL